MIKKKKGAPTGTPLKPKKLNGRIATKRNTVKLAHKKLTKREKTKQVCNYYLSRLERLYTDTEKTESIDEELERKLISLIDIYDVECKEDLLYLPDKIVKVSSIYDVIYYEAIYGKEIYQKENYKGQD